MQGNTGCDVPKLGHPVPLLRCADDLVLIGRSASGLQRLLNTLYQFSTCCRLQVSIKKTEVLVSQQYRPALSSLPTLYNHRKPLKNVHQFKYLGLTLDTQGGFKVAIAQQSASARRAAFAVRHQRCRQGISSLDCSKLFNAKVLPILSYGCEVWFGTCCKDFTKRRWAEAAEQVHRESCVASLVCLGVHLPLMCLQSLEHMHWLCIGLK